MKKQTIFVIGITLVILFSLSACSLFDSEEGSVPEPTTAPAADQPEVDDPQEPTPQPQQEQPGAEEPVGQGPGNPQGPGGPQGPGQQPGSGCTDKMRAISNVTNGDTYQPNTAIELVWTLENLGTCTWDSNYGLAFIDGDIEPTELYTSISGTVEQGDSISITIFLTTPASNGMYASVWLMQNSDGQLFGQVGPNPPLRMALKVIGGNNQNPTPTPEPTQQPEPEKEYTLNIGECYDFNSSSVVDCSDGSEDISYQQSPYLGGMFFPKNGIDFSQPLQGEPDRPACEGASYVPIPITITEGKWYCFTWEENLIKSYGFFYIEEMDEDGVNFESEMLGSEPLTTMPVTSPFVLVEGEQLTILTDQCFDAQAGTIMDDCSGVFGGFDYTTITVKSVDFTGMDYRDTYVSAAFSSQPSKEDCQNAEYTYEKNIWQVSDGSYYCISWIPGTIGYYGWIRPTHHNENGMTFDYLTWDSTP